MSMNRIAVAPDPVNVRRYRPPSSGNSSRSSAAASSSPTALSFGHGESSGPPCVISADQSPATTSPGAMHSWRACLPCLSHLLEHGNRGECGGQVLVGQPGVDHPAAQVGLVGSQVQQAMPTQRGHDDLLLAGLL